MSAINTPSCGEDKKTKLAAQKTFLPVENIDFVYSRAGRSVRVLAEMEEFPHRVRGLGIRGTFLVFGSARVLRRADYDIAVAALSARAEDPALPPADRAAAAKRLVTTKALEWACPVWETTRELSRLLSVWAMSPEGVRVGRAVYSHFPNGHADQPLIVCTGGGPGFMEAANLGCTEAPGAASMGVAVTLPFETSLNPYVSEGMGFRMEYFFTRKFWETFCAKALIVAPGGAGTCDEMFEIMTLMQCGHMKKVPIVLLGVKFWNDCINFRALANYGMLSHAEIDDLFITDDAAAAFEYVRAALVKEAGDAAGQGDRTPRA